MLDPPGTLKWPNGGIENPQIAKTPILHTTIIINDTFPPIGCHGLGH